MSIERTQLPLAGRPHEDLLSDMDRFRVNDAAWKEGKTWSMIYYGGDAHHEFLKKAHNLYFAENALNPMAFASLKRMENEVVQMTAGMLNGDAQAVGTMTSGGTESILTAVKTYRDRARSKWPWVRRPNMVIPETAHVAFDKAGHYFGVDVRHAKVHSDGRVDLASVRWLCNRNTILLVGSAPQYPTGAVDPIPELGAIALRKNIPLHVDACFGGFLLPWLERLGVPLPKWDFRVPGVTSISADVHKYGYAPKGASVLLYCSMDYLRFQFFVATNWPGGIYASPGMAGTRSGALIAAAWASMMAMGEDGYIELASRALEAANRLRAGIEACGGLKVLGRPDTTIVTYAAQNPRKIDIYAVADQLAAKGWGVGRQQSPPSIHCSVNAQNESKVAQYLDDLRDALTVVAEHPELSKQGEAAMYGMMAKVPIRGLVRNGVMKAMEGMYGPEGKMPEFAGTLK